MKAKLPISPIRDDARHVLGPRVVGAVEALIDEALTDQQRISAVDYLLQAKSQATCTREALHAVIAHSMSNEVRRACLAVLPDLAGTNESYDLAKHFIKSKDSKVAAVAQSATDAIGAVLRGQPNFLCIP